MKKMKKYMLQILSAVLLLSGFNACDDGSGESTPPMYNSDSSSILGRYMGQWRINQDDADAGIMTVTTEGVSVTMPCQAILARLLQDDVALQAVATVQAPAYEVSYTLLGSSSNSNAYQLAHKSYEFSFTIDGVRHTARINFRDISQAAYNNNSDMFIVILNVESITISDPDGEQVYTQNWTLTFYPDRHEEG